MRDIEKEIQETLREIAQTEHVRVLYAVESGSRAWGVEPPDSDYDVRFVFMRTMEDYLRLEEKRDVIEWQMDAVLDINGWDLKKTLQQFYRGNATLFEWSNSPVVYQTTAEWRQIYSVAQVYFSEKAALHHYYGTARSTFCKYLTGKMVRYKKYIYALRPLLACRYIEEYKRIPPVLFQTLSEEILPPALCRELECLLAVKGQSDEKTLNPKLPLIQSFIEEELVRLSLVAKDMKDDRNRDYAPLDKLFFSLVRDVKDIS